MKLPPIHPGEVLREEFMIPLLAKETGIPAEALSDLLNGRTGITPEVAARLAKRFKMTTTFWLNLQSSYEREQNDVIC